MRRFSGGRPGSGNFFNLFQAKLHQTQQRHRHHLHLERAQHRFLGPSPTFLHTHTLFMIPKAVFLSKTRRKRHIVVDTLGLILAVFVHPADVQDRDGAKLVPGRWKGRFERLQLIWADGGYSGVLIDRVHPFGGWTLEIVRRCDDVKGFKALPHRWVVERTFGWLGRHRRLSKDDEELTETSEPMIYLAMINLMAQRLSKT